MLQYISLPLCALALAVVEVHAAASPPVFTLSNGRPMPSFGLGTWLGFSDNGDLAPVNDKAVEKAVEHAIDVGYRLIDTAAIYDTEGQVGRAVHKKISAGVVAREDLFITTKLWNDRHDTKQVVPALKESLDILNLSYVDLYLIHWPVTLYPNGTIADADYLDTWKGMEEALNLGLTKSIGVSNFNQHQLERLLSHSSVKPHALQVEVNLNLQQPDLLAYCRSQNITVMGYTPFGSLFKGNHKSPPPRYNDPALVKIADKYKKTVAQVVLRYLADLGIVLIPKSVTNSRIEQNLDIYDFSLSEEERELLRGYDRHHRTIPVSEWIDSPYYPFEKH